MAVCHRSISIPTATRTERDLTHAVQFTRPPTACERRNRDRSILRPTRPHAQCGKPITQENKLPASRHDRPSTRVRPRFESKRTKRAIARALRPPATYQEELKDAMPPDRTPHRVTRHPQEPQQTNPRENAAKYAAPCFSSRTILLQPSRPNAMLSGCRAMAVGKCDLVGRQSA